MTAPSPPLDARAPGFAAGVTAVGTGLSPAAGVPGALPGFRLGREPYPVARRAVPTNSSASTA